MLPLAGYMGEATEHLAHRTSPTIGGLLNATFGNAAELIIAIVALRAGLVDLVKASITGSILGNLLLILGLAIIAGGIDRKALRFNRTSAGMSSGMLALSVVALVFPALFHGLHPEATARVSELRMSEAVAVVLLITYGCSLLFTLKTHRRMFGAEAHPLDGPVWSVGRALLVLGAATVGVAVESELLVHAATASTEALGLSTVFLGLIVIPIIGNAAEHAAAVVLARKGQIELGPPDRARLQHPGRPAGGADPGLRRRPHGPGDEPGLPALRGPGARHGHHRDRHHHPGRRVALVRGGPAPGGVRDGGRGRLLSLI